MNIYTINTYARIASALLLSAPVLRADEASTDRGVRIDASEITAEQIAAVEALLQPALDRPALERYAKLDFAAINTERARHRVAICYGQDTHPETMAKQEGALAPGPTDVQPNFNLVPTGWDLLPGTPHHFTVSFVPDGTFIPALSFDDATITFGAPSVLIARMDAQFAGVGGRSTWVNNMVQVFSRWAQVTGTSYTFVQDDGAPMNISVGSPPIPPFSVGRGDIRIGMRAIDGAGHIAAVGDYPPDGDIVLDASETWSNPANSFLFLRNVMAHEHGHGLGLEHACPLDKTKIMENKVPMTVDGPQQDDIRGVHVRYGDFWEPNGFFNSHPFLGTITTAGRVLPSVSTLPATPSGFATPNARRTSIHGFGDEDWFDFSLNTSWITTVTVTPIGTTYLSGPQNSDKTCSAGSNVDALRMANLGVEISGPCDFFGLPGTCARAVSRGRGLSETISTVLPAGRFSVKVFSTDIPSGPQLYNLSVSGTEPMRFEASQGTFNNRVVLEWSDVPGINAYELLRNTTDDLAGATETRTVGASQLIDTRVTAGRTYYYWLTADVRGSGIPEIIAGPVTGYAQ